MKNFYSNKDIKLNILLIKHNQYECSKIAESLSESGHHVVECTNEKEALELFQTGNFHMVLNEKLLRPNWCLAKLNKLKTSIHLKYS